jgi:hypothetical protein
VRFLFAGMSFETVVVLFFHSEGYSPLINIITLFFLVYASLPMLLMDIYAVDCYTLRVI